MVTIRYNAGNIVRIPDIGITKLFITPLDKILAWLLEQNYKITISNYNTDTGMSRKAFELIVRFHDDNELEHFKMMFKLRWQ